MIRPHPVVCLIPAIVVVGAALVAIAVNKGERQLQLAKPILVGIKAWVT